jgi:hypothetical protein
VQDDHDAQPFNVEFAGSTHWYREAEVELASSAGGATGGAPPPPPRLNSAGRAVHTSQGRYYCGYRGPRSGSAYYNGCQSCDGQCGPSNGCTCSPCHELNVAEGREEYAPCAAAASARSPPAAPRGVWECSICTFHNPLSKTTACEICGTARPVAAGGGGSGSPSAGRAHAGTWRGSQASYWCSIPTQSDGPLCTHGGFSGGGQSSIIMKQHWSCCGKTKESDGVCTSPAGWQQRAAAPPPSSPLSGLITVGDRVRVRPGIDPSYGWGGVSAGDIGVVVRMDSDGDVSVNFDGHSSWNGKGSEMEKVSGGSARAPDAGAIAVGDRVRVRPGITPSYSWGGVGPRDIGLVVRMDSDGDVVVDFDKQKGWNGKGSEMERVGGGGPPAPSSAGNISVGDKVRVRAGVVKPQYGWGSARAGDVGTVVSVESSDRIRINWDKAGGQQGWIGKSSELERVQGSSGGGGGRKRLAVGDRVRLSTTCTDATGVLGKQADRRVGEVVRDDHDNCPFKVKCEGKESWYREHEIEAVDPRASSSGGHGEGGGVLARSRIPVGATVVASAGSKMRCLGDPALKREGILLKDDGTDLPYKVSLLSGGAESWYELEELVLLRPPAPIPFAGHPGGHWRDVNQKLSFSAAGEETITTYCSSKCAHRGESNIEANHWSCCGSRERGAAVCRQPHPHALSPSGLGGSFGSFSCNECHKSGPPQGFMGCRACDYDCCEVCYSKRPAALKARDSTAGK